MKIAAAVAAAALLALLAYQRTRHTHRRAPNTKTWTHGVHTAKSLLPNAGDGLFATKHFKKNDHLGEYRGRLLTLAQAASLPNTDYLMGGFGINVHIDARFTLDAPGRYVNDNFDAAAINATFVKDKKAKRATLVATRDIRAGEEIYASYGESYWSVRGVDVEAETIEAAARARGARESITHRVRRSLCALSSQ